MSKFHKTSVEIDAVQYTGRNITEIMAFVETDATEYEEDFRGTFLVLTTSDGNVRLNRNDWLVRGLRAFPDSRVDFGLYSMPPWAFAAQYVPSCSGIPHTPGPAIVPAPSSKGDTGMSALDVSVRLTADQVAAGCWLCACWSVRMVWDCCMACGETVDSRLTPERRAQFAALSERPADNTIKE
jgi:hypothetical protein